MRKEFEGVTYSSECPGRRTVVLKLQPDGTVPKDAQGCLERMLKKPGYRAVTVFNERGGSINCQLGQHTGRKDPSNALEQAQQGVAEVDDEMGWGKSGKFSKAVLEYQTSQARSDYLDTLKGI